MNNDILDDGQLPKKIKRPKHLLAWLFFIAGFAVFAYNMNISETALVQWSYLYIPLMVIGLITRISTLRNGIKTGLLSVVLLYLFYQIFWFGHLF